MLRRRPLLVLLVAAACALAPSRASAHPADMYAQDQTITLSPLGLQLDWRILPGPFLADAAWAAADANHDGLIAVDEARAWVAPFLTGLTITLDSQPLPFPRTDTIHWPASVDVLRTGEEAVTVRLSFAWASPLTARHALEIHNAYLESNSLNWFSLTGSGGVRFGRPAQDNGLLTLDLLPPSAAPSSASSLAAWTSGTPNLPDFSASLSGLAFKLAPSQPSTASRVSAANGASTAGQAAQPGATEVTSALTGLVRNVQLSPYFLLSAFLLSLALGSLHALTPGHGKALVSAYLVGSQGRTRDAVLLGAIVTLTHTGSVLILGLVTLVASHYILPSLIVPWLELASGSLVVLFGLNLLFQRIRQRGHAHAHPHTLPPVITARSPVSGERFASAKPLGPEQRSGLLAPWRKVGNELPRSTDLRPSIEDRPRESGAPSMRDRSKVSSRSLLALGISSGLVPCPDAIAILLVAVTLNRVPFGMLLIVAFSLGLAAVLIAIGIAMVRGVSAIDRSGLLARRDWLTGLGIYAPMISAVVVTGLGAGLVFNAWRSFRFTQAMSAGPQSILARVAKQSPVPAANAVGGMASSSLLYVAADSSGHDQLFLLSRSGGSPKQYTREPNGITGYSVSLDGRTILYSVFTVDGGSSLWALQPDSSGAVGSPHKVLDCPSAECNTPVFYPDGSQVAYERLENTTDAVTIPRFSIWWLDLRSGKTQRVFQDASYPSTAPQFSPNGQWLSYISTATNTLTAFNLKDGRTLAVPLGSQSAIPETWSPDGAALLFGSAMPATSGSAVVNGIGTSRVKVYTVATGKVTDLGGAADITDLSAAWSPDGKWIAADRDVPTSDASGSSNQVWLVRPDGAQAHVLLNEAGASYSSLGWSPDARFLLYSRYTLDTSSGLAGTGRFDVCSVDVTTGETVVLVPGGDIAQFLP